MKLYLPLYSLLSDWVVSQLVYRDVKKKTTDLGLRVSLDLDLFVFLSAKAKPSRLFTHHNVGAPR